jgi:uncharacterized protein YkwD
MHKRLSSAIATGVAVAAALAVSAPSASAADSCADIDAMPSVIGVDRANAAVSCLVNHERTTFGLNALSVDGKLTLAAQTFSLDMAVRNFFSHVSPDGRDPGDRITAVGFNWLAYGENIAYGQQTPREVMTAWLASEGHCENLFKPEFTVAGYGVGYAGTRAYWTQDFGRPLSAGNPPRSTTPAPSCPRAPTPFGTPAVVPTPAATPAPAAAPTTTNSRTTRAVVRRVGKKLQVSVSLPGRRGKISVRVKVQQGSRVITDKRLTRTAGSTQKLRVQLRKESGGKLFVRAGSGPLLRVVFG